MISLAGFASQGNEFSFHMLLPSFFILNLTPEVNSHTLYPYIHSFSNHLSTEKMLRPVTIPDVSPTDLPKNSDFSLVAGDFLDVYGRGSEDGKWDVIATSFFIDTAKVVVEYLETIKRCLAPGGTWINLGPLLWHWENNSTNEPSIELSLDEVKALCSEMGFVLKVRRDSAPVTREIEGVSEFDSQISIMSRMRGSSRPVTRPTARACSVISIRSVSPAAGYAFIQRDLTSTLSPSRVTDGLLDSDDKGTIDDATSRQSARPAAREPRC